MSREVTVTLYEYEELSDKAKEKARDWFREGALDYEWWDAVYDDFIQVAGILGIEIRHDKRRGFRICFSGFASQGDGASFEGYYSYSKNAHKKIREYAPEDKVLHSIADQLLEMQKANGYRLIASIDQSGHYSHSGTMSGEVYKNGEEHYDDPEVMSLMRELADWLYQRLHDDYVWQMSDETVADNIVCNEYEFYANGQRSRLA